MVEAHDGRIRIDAPANGGAASSSNCRSHVSMGFVQTAQQLDSVFLDSIVAYMMTDTRSSPWSKGDQRQRRMWYTIDPTQASAADPQVRTMTST
jgi:hypothetical protein